MLILVAPLDIAFPWVRSKIEMNEEVGKKMKRKMHGRPAMSLSHVTYPPASMFCRLSLVRDLLTPTPYINCHPPLFFPHPSFTLPPSTSLFDILLASNSATSPCLFTPFTCYQTRSTNQNVSSFDLLFHAFTSTSKPQPDREAYFTLRFSCLFVATLYS